MAPPRTPRCTANARRAPAAFRAVPSIEASLLGLALFCAAIFCAALPVNGWSQTVAPGNTQQATQPVPVQATAQAAPPAAPLTSLQTTQQSASATAKPATGAPTAQAKPALAASSAKTASPPRITKPEWKELSTAEQQALKPLVANWTGMSEAQKRKWIALSKNYASMNPADQARLHTRMTDWVALSQAQRTQARINFAETKALTKTLSPEQRKAQWQAYQDLSPEEKKKLAASSQTAPVGAATAVKPVPQKLATAPVPQKTASHAQAGASNATPHSPKITIPPHLARGNSLLPKTASAEPAPKATAAP